MFDGHLSVLHHPSGLGPWVPGSHVLWGTGIRRDWQSTVETTGARSQTWDASIFSIPRLPKLRQIRMFPNSKLQSWGNTKKPTHFELTRLLSLGENATQPEAIEVFVSMSSSILVCWKPNSNCTLEGLWLQKSDKKLTLRGLKYHYSCG